MPTYHALQTSVKLRVASLDASTTKKPENKKCSDATRLSEVAQDILQHGTQLRECLIGLSGEVQHVNLLGSSQNVPFLIRSIDYNPLWYSHNGSLDVQALALELEISEHTFLRPMTKVKRDRGAQDLMVSVYFNGSLSHCKYFAARNLRSLETKHLFTGNRLAFLAERPWVLVPGSLAADGSLGPTKRHKHGCENVRERWEALGAAILKEADKLRFNHQGERQPLADFLESVSKLAMPPDVETLQRPGGNKFGIIDVVVSAGRGKKRDSSSGYLTKPEPMLDSRFTQTKRPLVLRPLHEDGTENQKQSSTQSPGLTDTTASPLESDAPGAIVRTRQMAFRQPPLVPSTQKLGSSLHEELFRSQPTQHATFNECFEAISEDTAKLPVGPMDQQMQGEGADAHQSSRWFHTPSIYNSTASRRDSVMQNLDDPFDLLDFGLTESTVSSRIIMNAGQSYGKMRPHLSETARDIVPAYGSMQGLPPFGFGLRDWFTDNTRPIVSPPFGEATQIHGNGYALIQNSGTPSAFGIPTMGSGTNNGVHLFPFQTNGYGSFAGSTNNTQPSGDPFALSFDPSEAEMQSLFGTQDCYWFSRVVITLGSRTVVDKQPCFSWKTLGTMVGGLPDAQPETNMLSEPAGFHTISRPRRASARMSNTVGLPDAQPVTNMSSDTAVLASFSHRRRLSIPGSNTDSLPDTQPETNISPEFAGCDSTSRRRRFPVQTYAPPGLPYTQPETNISSKSADSDAFPLPPRLSRLTDEDLDWTPKEARSASSRLARGVALKKSPFEVPDVIANPLQSSPLAKRKYTRKSKNNLKDCAATPSSTIVTNRNPQSTSTNRKRKGDHVEIQSAPLFGVPELSQGCIISFAQPTVEQDVKVGPMGIVRQIKCERPGDFQENEVVFACRYVIGDGRA